LILEALYGAEVVLPVFKGFSFGGKEGGLQSGKIFKKSLGVGGGVVLFFLKEDTLKEHLHP